MEIYIPTRARADKQITADTLQEAAGVEPILVISKCDKDKYPEKYNTLRISESGITNTRNAILQKAGKRFLMLDDDMTFFKRNKSDNKCTRLSTHKQFSDMFQGINKLLDKYPIVGVAERFLIHTTPYPLRFACRQLHLFAVNKELLPQGIKFRGRLFEDVDIVMQCLLAGKTNVVMTNYAQHQKKQGAPGGCNTWRTEQLEHEENERFTKRWKGYISPARDGQVKKFVIHWRRLAEAGGVQL